MQMSSMYTSKGQVQLSVRKFSVEQRRQKRHRKYLQTENFVLIQHIHYNQPSSELFLTSTFPHFSRLLSLDLTDVLFQSCVYFHSGLPNFLWHLSPTHLKIFVVPLNPSVYFFCSAMKNLRDNISNTKRSSFFY